MQHKRNVVLGLCIAFALGAGMATVAGPGGVSSAWSDADPDEASEALLKLARVEAGSSSWENIAIGRVYYLSGRKDEGQAIFDSVLESAKVKNSDRYRVGRVYVEADEPEKGIALFEEALALKPNLDREVELGCFKNLSGDREGAEKHFASGFAKGGTEWTLSEAAGSYVGVRPDH